MTTADLVRAAPSAAVRWRSVVIIDDSVEDRAEIRRLLVSHGPRGYRFVEAETGMSGVRLILGSDNAPPYCVVLDHNLPDMDAPAVLAALTDHEGQLYCPVVVLTGNDDAAAGRHVLRAGAQDFIGKSWMTAAGLTRAVENAVERFSMVRELRAKNAAIIEMQLQAFELLRDGARRKDEFLATLAHELRNPLAPLSTGLEMMRMLGDPSTAELREMMTRQIQTLVRLVDDLLDVSRISSGKVSIRRDVIAVQSVIESAVEMSRPLMLSATHTLTLDVPGKSILVLGDLTRLAQVVSNLLNNAAKYTPRGGQIQVRLSVDGADAVIEVVDNGIGIAPDVLPTVFDLFTQADLTSDRAAGGLGIGLMLVQRFVQMHGGTVGAQSKGLTTGSTFTIRLPITQASDTPTPQINAVRTPGKVPSRRILVVDDNVDAAESLAELLRLSGHTVRTCHNGKEALVVAREFDPHAGFIDLGLPGLNGELVAQALRAAETDQRMLLVAVTGWGTDEDKRRTRLAGFDLHLTKPAQWEQVVASLAQLDVR